MEYILAALLISSACVIMVTGHGRLIEPPGRSTMWRYGYNTVHNTDDHQLSCGGFGVQFYQNGGKCGVCGDRYDGVRDNEAGGKFAKGITVHTYGMGETFQTRVDITVNHGGWFEFKLCPVNDKNKRATQDCFDKYLLRQTNGATRYQVRPGLGTVAINLELPRDLTCSQCVLQWRWNTASNVRCDGSNCCRGCGPQEQFYGCADIKITGDKNNNSPYQAPVHVVQTPAPYYPPVYVAQTAAPYKPPVHVAETAAPYKPPVFVAQTAAPTNKPNVPHIQPGLNMGFPGSFIPVSANVGQGQTSGCRATANFRFNNFQADQWCVNHCASGLCPRDYCEDACRTNVQEPVAPQAGPVCKAKPFWRQKFPLPSLADKWCVNKCSVGVCPLDYCEQSCWSAQ